MNILKEVAKELLGMFLADARLTVTVLVLVAIVAGLVMAAHLSYLGGAVLITGCLAIVVEAAAREARARNAHN